MIPGLGTAIELAERMFYVVPDAPKRYEGQKRIVRRLIEAIAFRKEVRVDYDASTTGPSSRTLQPLTLLSYRSALYLLMVFDRRYGLAK